MSVLYVCVCVCAPARVYTRVCVFVRDKEEMNKLYQVTHLFAVTSVLYVYVCVGKWVDACV